MKRVIGLNIAQAKSCLMMHGDWVVVAEIWQHTDIANPTNEQDIVRLADDFGRAN